MFLPFKQYIKQKLYSFVVSIIQDQKIDLKFDILQSEIDKINANEVDLFARVSESNTRLSHDILITSDRFEKNLHSAAFACKEDVKNLKAAVFTNMGHVMGESGQAGAKSCVVYTCLTGGYDMLPPPEYVHAACDYVCFTDNERLLQQKRWGVWHIQPLRYAESDNTRNARWHKTHPHALFPEYKESVWTDSNMTMRSGWIFEETARRNTDMLIPIHFERDCIYQEIEACGACGKEQQAPLQKVLAFLQAEHFPEHYGLNETNLIYRRHNDKKVIALMEAWWGFIRDYSKRDQLSLSYVLWKNGITPESIAIPNLRSRYADFLFARHAVQNSALSVLPAYSAFESVFAYNIDIYEFSETHSYIVGYAFMEGIECSIFIGCKHLDGSEVIYKADHFPRPDVQQGNNLPADTAGFSVEADDFFAKFSIYLVDEESKKIYFTEYVCPQI